MTFFLAESRLGQVTWAPPFTFLLPGESALEHCHPLPSGRCESQALLVLELEALCDHRRGDTHISFQQRSQTSPLEFWVQRGEARVGVLQTLRHDGTQNPSTVGLCFPTLHPGELDPHSPH